MVTWFNLSVLYIDEIALNLKKTCLFPTHFCTHHNVYRCTILITSQSPAWLETARSSATSCLMEAVIARMLWSQRRDSTQRPADRPLVFEHDELLQGQK